MSDDLDDLIQHALDRIETDGPSALEELCSERPELADDVRERIRLLGEYGLLDAPEPGPTVDEAGRRLGDFRLVRRLGGGGMGVVYLAVQESLGREVAVKLIRSDQLFHPGARARFQREVDLVARLKHEAIVPIHAVGAVDGVPYFAMERIEGTTLESLLDALRDEDPATFDARRIKELVARLAGEGARPSPDWQPDHDWRRFCLETARTVARALEHAHRRGVVHRDVKPSNVMVSTDGRIFLTDFGLAQAEDDVRLTQSGSVIGSLPYLSPERVRGEPADVQSDVYGLGATLYELWTFRAPYQADSAELLASRIVETAPSSPRRRNRRLGRDDDTVVLTALDPDLGRRYGSAAAFADDLDALLHRREIQARPLGPLLRTARLVARHKGPAAAAVFGFLLFVVAPIAFSFWQVRSNERLAEAYGRAVDEQARAVENLRSAQKAVELILHETASQLLTDVPQMARARQRILESAVTFYEPLLAQEPEDRRSRFELSMMRRSLGDLYVELDRRGEAKEQLERQLATLMDLLKHPPADPAEPPTLRELYHQLGTTHAQIGWVEDQDGDQDEALERTREGIEWFERALALPGDVANTWLQHAIALAGLAQLYRERGDAAAAVEPLDRALASARRAVELDDENRLAVDALARVLTTRAALQHDAGDFEVAAASQADALELLRPLLDEDAPLVSRITFVALLQNHGTALVKLGRLEEGIEILREAIDRLTPLVAAFPDQSAFLRILADTWNSLGLAYSNLARGDGRELEAYREAVAVHRRYAERGSGELGPFDGFTLALSNLASAEMDHGDLDAAERAATEALGRIGEVDPLAPGAPIRGSLRQQAEILLARVALVRGDFEAVERRLADVLEQDVRDPRIPAACAELWMSLAERIDGRRAEKARFAALQALERAIRLGFDDLETLRSIDAFQPLLADPRMAPLLESLRRP